MAAVVTLSAVWLRSSYRSKINTISARSTAVAPAMIVTVTERVVAYTAPTPASTPLTSVRRAPEPSRWRRGRDDPPGEAGAGAGAALFTVVIPSDPRAETGDPLPTTCPRTRAQVSRALHHERQRSTELGWRHSYGLRGR